ncbi:hypothetical protein [Mumia sp. Pv 4-285]|uniref:hypothetical protein n=1 Tax=Mumia qirimensis TaxID=3234852 RepID=UPI00351D733C
MTDVPTNRSLLLKSLGIGLASGGRASLGPAVTAFASDRPAPARAAALVAVAGELIGDKLPRASSRLKAPSLSGRVLSGAGTGAFLARSAGEPVLVPAAVAGGAAVVGSFAGLAWRRAWARTGRPDLPAAVVEDAVVIGLAYAVYRATSSR